MQDKFHYRTIIDLGFKEIELSDIVFHDIYGFSYSIITKKLSKTVYLDWAKETQLCKMVRIDNPVDCNIKAELPIKDYDQLVEIINFYSDKKVEEFDYTKYA